MTNGRNGSSGLASRGTLVASATLAVLAVVFWRLWSSLRDASGITPHSIPWKFADSIPTLLVVIALTLLIIHAGHLAAMHRYKGDAPKLVRQIIIISAWTIAGGILAGSVFEVPLGSLVTTSGLMVAVVGIALKNMISDLFTGLSLPVKMGDWIEVDGIVGKVTEVSWRATRLLTRDDVTMIIPNTHLMSKPFRNFSQPTPHYRESFRITLPAAVTAHQAERNLVAAARQVDVIAALPYNPEARIAGFNDRGIEWEVRYHVPDAADAPSLRYRVQRNLMRNLHYSGIKLPTAVIHLHPAAAPIADLVASQDLTFLGGFDLFATLLTEDLRYLCQHMARKLAKAAIPIVRQGEDGDSLFILKEGLLSVSIVSDGLDSVVGQIAPGNFFGEMSLLTGAPRSATVVPLVDSLVYEIKRDALLPIMQSRPAIAEQMSVVLAERQSVKPTKRTTRKTLEDNQKSLSKQILGRITTFFRLAPEGSQFMMRVVSANLNGIRSAVDKGFLAWVDQQSPDFVCMQEVKAQIGDMSPAMLAPPGLFGTFHVAEKKGYSGVGIYARHPPREIIEGVGVPEIDAEGRYIEFVYDGLSIISIYFPSGSSGEHRQAAKFRFMDHVFGHLARLAKHGSEVILCGDWNIAHKEIDLKNWKGNMKNSGFLPEERAWLTRIFAEQNWIDVYRNLHPNAGEEGYTWWSNRGQAWAKNVGWRIDYQIATPRIAQAARAASIFKDRRFSDHAPLTIDYDWDLA